jgi:hypothetical protein
MRRLASFHLDTRIGQPGQAGQRSFSPDAVAGPHRLVAGRLLLSARLLLVAVHRRRRLRWRFHWHHHRPADHQGDCCEQSNYHDEQKSPEHGSEHSSEASTSSNGSHRSFFRSHFSRGPLSASAQRHSKYHCLLTQSSYAPLELTRDHGRPCFLARERL